MEYNTKLNIVMTASPMNRVTLWSVKDVFSNPRPMFPPKWSQFFPNLSKSILDLAQTFVGHNKSDVNRNAQREWKSHHCKWWLQCECVRCSVLLLTHQYTYRLSTIYWLNMKRDDQLEAAHSTMAVRHRNNSSLVQMLTVSLLVVRGVLILKPLYHSKITRESLQHIEHKSNTGGIWSIKAMSLISRYDNVIRSSYGLDSTMTGTSLRSASEWHLKGTVEMDPTETILHPPWGFQHSSLENQDQSRQARCDKWSSSWRSNQSAIKKVRNTVCDTTDMSYRCRLRICSTRKVYLASCSSDHSLIVWNLRYGGMLKSADSAWRICPSAHLSVVSDVCWDTNTERLALHSSWDHNIQSGN